MQRLSKGLIPTDFPVKGSTELTLYGELMLRAYWNTHNWYSDHILWHLWFFMCKKVMYVNREKIQKEVFFHIFVILDGPIPLPATNSVKTFNIQFSWFK